jgi:hypothetical protein
MRKLLLSMLPLLLAACVGTGVQPGTSPHPVTGEWGGTHVALHLQSDGGTIDYDCAHGTIDAPVLADADGAFRVAGSHVREHGGPVRMGEVLPHEPAIYEGRVHGDRMTLQVRTAATTLGPFALQKDAQAQLFRCL